MKPPQIRIDLFCLIDKRERGVTSLDWETGSDIQEVDREIFIQTRELQFFLYNLNPPNLMIAMMKIIKNIFVTSG